MVDNLEKINVKKVVDKLSKNKLYLHYVSKCLKFLEKNQCRKSYDLFPLIF